MSGIIDFHENNQFFDLADQVIILPDVEDVRITDPEVYLQRLADIQAPRERLIEFFKSQFDFSVEATHEAVYIRTMALSGLAFGWLFGGLNRSRHYFESFQRQYNAAVFENNHRAKRLYVDNYVYNILRRGAKYGLGSCLLCTTAGLIGFGSISYRNKLYLPDWLIGFGALGGLSRSFLGVRGLVFGTGMGILGGAFAFGFARMVEVTSGNSVTQLRYLNHMNYLKRRDAYLNSLYRVKNEVDQEMISKIR